MIKKISYKIGFSETEIKVLLFVVVMLVIGFAYRSFNSDKNEKIQEFDYSLQDSLFLSSSDSDYFSYTRGNSELKEEVKSVKKTEQNFSEKKSIEILKEKSINLNQSTKEELKLVPGIGDKTADNILELRKKLGSFTNINQLLDVKGIGKSKLDKIKIYFFIE